MFNRTTYVPYEKSVSVTEKRAPTDASIKLLNEMTEKAKENIVANIPIKDNLMNGHLMAFHNDVMGLEVYGKCTLNGHELKFNKKYPYYETWAAYENSILRDFYRFVASEMATMFLVEVVKQDPSKIIASAGLDKQQELECLINDQRKSIT